MDQGNAQKIAASSSEIRTNIASALKLSLLSMGFVLRPPVQLDREPQPEASEHVGSHRVAEPVLPHVDSGRSHERDPERDRGQEKSSSPRSLEQRESEKAQETAERHGREDVAAG